MVPLNTKTPKNTADVVESLYFSDHHDSKATANKSFFPSDKNMKTGSGTQGL